MQFFDYEVQHLHMEPIISNQYYIYINHLKHYLKILTHVPNLLFQEFKLDLINLKVIHYFHLLFLLAIIKNCIIIKIILSNINVVFCFFYGKLKMTISVFSKLYLLYFFSVYIYIY